MTLQLHERRQNNPQYTPEEESIGVYLEQLEPQVREAVLEFNRKGYRTISSGFSGGFSRGEYNPEHQEIAGHFFVDDETKQKLAAMEVEVTTEPSWTWEMDKKLGKADPNTPPEGRLITTVRFQAKHPDLQEIKNKWEEIASGFSDTWFEQAFMDICGQYPMKVLYPQGIMSTHLAGQAYFQRESPSPGASAMPPHNDASVSR